MERLAADLVEERGVVEGGAGLSGQSPQPCLEIDGIGEPLGPVGDTGGDEAEDLATRHDGEGCRRDYPRPIHQLLASAAVSDRVRVVQLDRHIDRELATPQGKLLALEDGGDVVRISVETGDASDGWRLGDGDDRSIAVNDRG